jgi:hypothetical protein
MSTSVCARERGFRNICDPSVFVGHAGSRSFGKEKRALVVQNLEALQTRYPDYRGECAAFMAADPLRAARAAIERASPPSIRFERLIACGSGAVESVARRRGSRLSRRGAAVLSLIVRNMPSGPEVLLCGADGTAPQSLSFHLAEPGERAALADYLRACTSAALKSPIRPSCHSTSWIC